MICPKCNKEFGYLRIHKNEWVCRHCGEITGVNNGTGLDADTKGKDLPNPTGENGTPDGRNNGNSK